MIRFTFKDRAQRNATPSQGIPSWRITQAPRRGGLVWHSMVGANCRKLATLGFVRKRLHRRWQHPSFPSNAGQCGSGCEFAACIRFLGSGSSWSLLNESLVSVKWPLSESSGAHSLRNYQSVYSHIIKLMCAGVRLFQCIDIAGHHH